MDRVLEGKHRDYSYKIEVFRDSTDRIDLYVTTVTTKFMSHGTFSDEILHESIKQIIDESFPHKE